MSGWIGLRLNVAAIDGATLRRSRRRQRYLRQVHRAALLFVIRSQGGAYAHPEDR